MRAVLKLRQPIHVRRSSDKSNNLSKKIKVSIIQMITGFPPGYFRTPKQAMYV